MNGVQSFLNSIRPIREVVCIFAGIVGCAITYLFGEWTEAMTTLVILMVIDYLTGIAVAAVFKNSSKTKGGGLKSSVGFKGLIKKFVELLIVAGMYRIDLMANTTYLRDICIFGFAFNELISITENAGLMGINLPPGVSKAIELLNTKANDTERED